METNEELYPLWRTFIQQGEMTMLAGHPEEAEQLYLKALAAAKYLPESEPYWIKIKANLRYLYVNFLCQHPVTPDNLYARTVPIWSQVLSADHYFIIDWANYINDWREQIASPKQ